MTDEEWLEGIGGAAGAREYVERLGLQVEELQELLGEELERALSEALHSVLDRIRERR